MGVPNGGGGGLRAVLASPASGRKKNGREHFFEEGVMVHWKVPGRNTRKTRRVWGALHDKLAVDSAKEGIEKKKDAQFA